MKIILRVYLDSSVDELEASELKDHLIDLILDNVEEFTISRINGEIFTNGQKEEE